MRTTKSTSPAWLLAMILLLTPLMAACEARISRNADGSFSVQTTVTQAELQSVIMSSLADPLVKEVTVSLQSGYLLVTGRRQRLNDARVTDTLTFRLDLAVQGGHLAATVSGAQINGVPVQQNRVDNWNQTIANRLENLGRRRPNATLQSVSVTPAGLIMDWHVTR